MHSARFTLTSLAVLLCALFVGAEQPQQPPAPAAQTGVAAPAQAPQGRGQRGRGAGRGAARTRKVVLAWADTRNGQAQHDSVSHALAVIERLGYESGAYDTYIRTDSNIISKSPLKTTGQPASGGPSLGNVDAIFFMGHRDVPLDDAQKAELLAFVRDEGKGFVAAHVGLTASNPGPSSANCSAHASTGIRSTDPVSSSTRMRPFLPRGISPRRSISRMSSTSRRSIRETRFTSCFGWTSRTCRPTRACIAPTATTRWPGRRCTARDECSTAPSPTPPLRGTSGTFSRCTSRRSSGPSGSPTARSNPTP